MTAGWPPAVERVASYLRAAHAEARIEEFSAGTPTAEDAARAVGCDLQQIVKSLLFECDGRLVLALVPGDVRAGADKVAKAAGAERARVVPARLVEDKTGFPPGGVAPFALPGVERFLLDRSLLAHDEIWVGAGSPSHMAVLAPVELLRLTRGEPVDLAAG